MSRKTITPEDVIAARARIRNHVTKTPLLFSPFLSGSAKVYIKMESEQITGSFKIRGAFNKLFLLSETDPDSLKRGVFTASSGNHGLGCIMAANAVGCDLQVFCSNVSCPSKRACLEAHGANLSVHGQDCVEAEAKARQTAEERNGVYISPYNDPDVAAGNGTVAIEILEDLPDVDVVFVAVGGGGFIGGMARYLKHAKPSVQVIGCQPINSKVMYESVKAGRIIYEDSQDTLSDATAGGIEEGSITFELNRDYVDDWLLVNEEQIAECIYFMLDKHKKLVEGAAGTAIAAYMFNKEKFKGKTVAIVSCGNNIGVPTLKKVIDKYCPE